MNWVKISEIAELQGGFAFKSSEFKDEGIPLIRIGEINTNKIIIGIKTVYVSEKYLKTHNKYVLNTSDILIALSGATTGKFARYTSQNKMLLNQRVLRIRGKKDVDERYLYYSMNILKSKIKNKAAGAAQPNISPNEIGNFKIPLPPLEIQNKIVEVLDKAQELIDARKEQIKLLDDLIQSVFYDMFGDPVTNPKGWEIKKISQFLKIDTKIVTDFECYGDYPHIGINNIEKNTGKISNFNTVKEDKIISGKYLFSSEHIIYSKIRPNLNKVALPNFYGLCSADSYPLLVNKTMADKVYVALMLRSNYFLDEILKHSSRTNIPKVNKAQLLSFNCILPPISMQNQFAKKVQKIESQKQLMQQSLIEMENNFNNLMQRAFKGELFEEK